VKDAPHAQPIDARGALRFEDVTFGYAEGRPVLKNVSVEAKPGEVVAIVGPTGAGKTTLVNMIVRFFDPWSGRVTLNGEDLRDVKLQSLREQVAMVLQDPYIFPMSAADNIAFGRPDATREEVMAAAKAANAHDFISRLPEGYDSVIGERGATLSGGEKQRLSIARAFLKDSPILILDEPTSALDANTERMLLDALERLMKGRLTFIIAHRLSTIRHADQILVVEEGQIVERGPHQQLVRERGLYSRLYSQQMEIATHDGEEPDVDTLVKGGEDGTADERPLVSIVITSFNHDRYLGDAIDSALAQTYDPVEVVVVDDGSVDRSRDVISRYDGIAAVFKERGGQTSALNAGFAAAHGEWVCFLDSDDVLMPEAIDRAMAAAEPGVSKVQWPLSSMDPVGRLTGELTPAGGLDEGDLRDAILRDGPEGYRWAPGSGNLFGRSFLEMVVPLDETWTHCRGHAYSDAELATLAPLFGRIESLERPLTGRRYHDANATLDEVGFEAKLDAHTQRYDYRCDLLAEWCQKLGLDADPQGWRDRSWLHRFPRLRAEIESLVEPGESLILVDDNQIGPEVAPDRHVIPFTERDGEWWGAPEDGAAAVAELDRLVGGAPTWVVFAWPAFWWLDHYAELDAHLRAISSSVIENDRLIAFRTQPKHAPVVA
jgi:ABC-type multidrug transport system ATPase subunit